METPFVPFSTWILAAFDPVLIAVAGYLGWKANQFAKVFLAAIVALAASVLAAAPALAQNAAPQSTSEPTSAAPSQPAAEPAAKPVPSPATAASEQTASSTEAEGHFVVPTVKVEGTAGGYRAAESGLQRLPTAIRDTPQQISVVPEQVIREQRATTVQDALRNTYQRLPVGLTP